MRGLAIGLVVSILLGLVGLGIQQYRVNDWRGKASEAEGTIATLRADKAQLKQALKAQNDKVLALQHAAQQHSDAAALAAVRVDKGADKARRAIETAGSGPQEMNRWMAETFSQPP